MNKSRRTVQKGILLLLFAALGLSGCFSTATKKTEDILTLKETEKGRTQISVLVKYAFPINSFEKIVEEKFPDIDIVQVGDYTANTTLNKEMEARLANDDLTDIVMTWPYDVGSENWEERLIDLSGLPFTSKYNLSMLDTLATEEGSLYYLPGPASIRGIVYNKTLFEENGWKVPNNYNEFVALCKTINASGYRAFQLPLGNDEVLDTAFVGFNYGAAYSKPSDTEWLDAYNQGEGNFLDQFDGAVDTFENLITEGIIQEEDLELTYSDTQGNLFSRKSVMTEDSVLLTHQGKEWIGTQDEFALMPMFTRNPQNDWARIYMVCYIGLNKHLEDSGNEDKYEKVLKLMDYISSEEGQIALAKDNGAMFSSLKNMPIPNVKEIDHLQTTLSQGRYGTFPSFERTNDTFHEGLRRLMKGMITKEEFAVLMDTQNQVNETNQKDKVLGKATETFSLIDTGNFVCDLLRNHTKSDISLFLDNGKDGKYNGKGISAKFYKGNINETDINRVFPDLKGDDTGELWVVEMLGKDIISTLEYALEAEGSSDWFYYFSGLKVEFNPYAKQGKRIASIQLDNGDKFDNKKVYTIAIMENSVPEEYIISKKKTGENIKAMIKAEIVKKETISPVENDRFIIKKNK